MHKAEHEKRNSISTSSHVVFCSLYKHTDNDFFDDFSKSSGVYETRRLDPFLNKNDYRQHSETIIWEGAGM